MVADPFTAAVALGAGLASFFSPCVLPVLPGLLAVVTGDGKVARRERLAVLGAFVAGFGVAFVAIGLAIGAAGHAAAASGLDEWVQRIGGIVVIAFGLHMLGLLKIPGLQRDGRHHGGRPEGWGRIAGAGFVGAAFGVGWSPCVGPIFASILVVVGVEGGVLAGGVLLGLYALGLGLPFLAIGVAGDRATEWIADRRRAAKWLERVGGVALIVLGIAVFTGSLARLTSYV